MSASRSTADIDITRTRHLVKKRQSSRTQFKTRNEVLSRTFLGGQVLAFIHEAWRRLKRLLLFCHGLPNSKLLLENGYSSKKGFSIVRVEDALLHDSPLHAILEDGQPARLLTTVPGDRDPIGGASPSRVWRKKERKETG